MSHEMVMKHPELEKSEFTYLIIFTKASCCFSSPVISILEN